MKNKLKTAMESMEFAILAGLVAVPLLSFAFIQISTESPLYTSISRIIWVHGHWVAALIWSLLVMGVIAYLTHRLLCTSPLTAKQQRAFKVYLFIHIVLVFVGCMLFPAKQSLQCITFFNYMHDYLTAAAWVGYIVGLLVYSWKLRKADRFLGIFSLGLISFVICSASFFLRWVIDPASYVGASAVSEVYIINSLLIYLVVMYVMQGYVGKLKEKGQ